MDNPLLTGESSGRRYRSRGMFRRTNAMASGCKYEKAAALIDLANDGVGIPEQILDPSNFQSYARFYIIFTKCNFIWSLSYFALIALNFLEKPLWCERNTTHSCKDREYFFLGQLPYLTAVECLIYEGMALILLIIHTFFPISYEGSHIYWKSAINQLKAFCLLVLIADMLGFDIQPFSIAPYIRVVLFILSIRELRETIIILAGMLKTYLENLAFWFLFLGFASLAAYVIFEDTIQGKTVFTSYGTTLYQMFLLFTANSPDVWVPAYKSSRWYCLFFILFVLVGVYFVTSLILAVIYKSFESELVKQVSEMERMRRSMLEKAFDLLDTNNFGYLNKNQCIRLYEKLKEYRTLPEISKEGFELIFDGLEDNHDVEISKDEFAEIGNVIINLKIQKAEVLSCFDDLAFYQSSTSKRLKDFVKRPMFEKLVYFVLILNLVAVIIETMLDIEDNSAQKLWQVVEFIFGPIYIIEIALKVYSYGFMNYWQDGQNRLDFIITLIIVIGETITFVSPDDALPSISNGEWIRYLLFARMLRLIRLLMPVLGSRVYVEAFLKLIPLFMPYLGIIFCALCIYCSLGVQIFGGIVNVGNPELEATDLANNDYLLFNFNDYPNGMVTLFNLLVTGVWKELMESYKELTGTSWTYLYFISFYLITVVLLFNLIAAFFLEAFFTQMELQTSKNCDANDKVIFTVHRLFYYSVDNTVCRQHCSRTLFINSIVWRQYYSRHCLLEVEGDEHRRRRSVGTKRRSKRVDALLHRILSAEFCQNQSSDTLNLVKSFCRMNKGKKCEYLQ